MSERNGGFATDEDDLGRVNLFDICQESDPGDAADTLQVVRLQADEVAVVPFTSEVTLARVHYCDEPEIRGYAHCNGADCVLCRAGRRVEERLLLPVYVPASRGIGVLPITRSCRPGALLPQVLPALRSGKRVVLLISRPDRARYHVGTVELSEGMEDGAACIKAFTRLWEARQIDLASVFPRHDNRDLAAIPAIQTMLRYKGGDGGHN
jgi:hypothetical protein